MNVKELNKRLKRPAAKLPHGLTCAYCEEDLDPLFVAAAYAEDASVGDMICECCAGEAWTA